MTNTTPPFFLNHLRYKDSDNMEKRHKLVFATIGVALLCLVGAIVFRVYQLPPPVKINTEGQSRVGTGNIEFVLFEDLACVNCHTFTKEVVPGLVSKYVNTGRGSFTVIPVSFQPHSKPLANAALAVYKMVPDRFIRFIIALLDIPGSGKAAILQVADGVGGIDLDRLAFAIDRRMYYSEIDRNLALAKNLIYDFGTPMLFINGYETSTQSFSALERRVAQIERRL